MDAMKRSLVFGVCALLAIGSAGCGPEANDFFASDENVGSVSFALVQVPSDVRCIELTASGSSVITSSFNVVPGASTTLLMTGLPSGSVEFTGVAYPAACAALNDESRPTWVADPLTATITSGATANLSLTMRPAGNANVSVDFVGGVATPPGWVSTFGDAQAQKALAVAVDASGAVYVGGWFRSTITVGTLPILTTAGGMDAFLVKYNSAGVVQWAKRFGDASDQALTHLAVDSSGNVNLAGTVAGSIDLGGGALTSAGGNDVFLGSVNTNGGHRWSRRFGNSANQIVNGLAVLPNKNVAVTGTFAGNIDFGTGNMASAGGNDIYLAQLTSSGTTVWAKRFGDTAEQWAAGLAADTAGNLALVASVAGTMNFGGGAYTSHGGYDAALALFGSSGTFVWNRFAGETNDQTPSGVCFALDGSPVVTGSFLGSMDLGGGLLTSAGGRDIFAAQFEASGSYLWSRRFGDAAEQTAQGIAEAASGGHILLGLNTGVVDFGGGAMTAVGTHDAVVAVLNDAGAYVSARAYGTTGSTLAASVASMPAGAGAYLAGYFTGTVNFGPGVSVSAGLEDAFLTQIVP